MNSSNGILRIAQSTVNPLLSERIVPLLPTAIGTGADLAILFKLLSVIRACVVQLEMSLLIIKDIVGKMLLNVKIVEV